MQFLVIDSAVSLTFLGPCFELKQTCLQELAEEADIAVTLRFARFATGCKQ